MNNPQPTEAAAHGSGYTVGEVSRLTGVSVRTLHHYDQIGLLGPAARSEAGYRLYSQPDLGRLQQILFYRALGFPLAVIEKELEARKVGISLTPEEQFEIFGTAQAGGEWAVEAERRWGDTEAWKQSQRRSATYTRQDWVEIQAESTAINQRYLDAMQAGLPAGSDQAMDLAEEHRQQISNRFYHCDYGMHRGLAELYLADERFGKHYDNMAPGLAQYIHDATLSNATRATT